MRIDIKEIPPADFSREKRRYTAITLFLLLLGAIAVFLGLARIVFVTGHDTLLEDTALGLFVGTSIVFFYFGGKLNEYKRLSPRQKKKLSEWREQYKEITRYLDKLAELGREPVAGEYEVFKQYVEDLESRSDS